MIGTATVHNRRTLRNFRNHLWLSASFGTLAFAVVIGLSLFTPIIWQIGHANVDAPERVGLVDHLSFLSGAFWPIVVVSLIASLAASSLLFQRMRAPLVRFVRTYQSIADGNVPPQLSLRAWDYLTEEADALNSMIAALRRQQAIRLQSVAQIEEAIADLATRGVPESVLAELQDIAKRLAAGTHDR